MKTLKGVLSMSKLIGLIITAIIFGALIGSVTDGTIGTPGGGNASLSNVTGATWTMFILIPLFLTIGLLVSFVTDM